MRQAEMYFFNLMQQLGLLKRANIVIKRVPARHPAPKTRCAALLASVLGHRSQKMQKNTQKAKSNGHVQANTRMQA